MVQVSLKRYCEEIESLIDDGAFNAAISHCQHILKSYPKYLPAYSLMGKAALEIGDLAAAADLFSRVLSVDPEDFVARVGMSIASDRDGSLDQAVWHMERAFELAPDNQAIIEELRRLYERRDGTEPEKIRLTQGALARLHARGNLYTQAVNEMHRLLQIEPDRIDLWVALAETLWRADRRIEAAETSLSVLEKLPHCLKANLILGEIWSSSGREKEAAAHLEHAQMIDPENTVVRDLFGKRSPLPPATVTIERLEYVAAPVAEEQETDWLQALIDEEPGPTATDEAIPDWLQAVADSAEIEPSPAPEISPPDSAQHPDWLQDVAATADEEAEAFASAPETTVPEPTEDEMPDWLARLTAEPATTQVEPLAPEEIPGWAEETAAPPAEELEAAPSDTPDWLAELAPTEAGPLEAGPAMLEEPEAAPSDMPDWLAELAPTEMEPGEAVLSGAEEPEAAPAELPDWLTELAPTADEPADSDDLGLAPAEIPDWLSEMAPPEAVSSVTPELDVAPAEVPDWLAEPGAAEPVEEEAEDAHPPLVAAETPDWLSELVEAAGATIEEEEVPVEEFAQLEKEAIPDWLTELGQEQPPAIVEPSAPEQEPPYPDAEADLMARMEDMSPEEAFAAWESLLAESKDAEEAPPAAEAAVPEIPTPAGPTVIEEPEKEALVYPEGAGGEVTDAEADLMARLEDMSPEEAFAAWESLLTESEAVEEAPSTPEAAVPEPPTPAGPIVIEEPEKEALVYPEGAGGEVTDAEADLMARLEDMSPEDAFAAWEDLLADSEEMEEAPSTPEAAVPEPPTPAGPIVIEEPEKEALVYPEDAAEKAPDAEADLMARLEDMSPEEAFAAWEALLTESEEVISEEGLPPAEAIAEAEQVWMALEEDLGAEEVEALAMVEEPLPIEPITELDQPDVPPVEGVAELDQAWMTLAADEGLEEITAPPIPEPAPTLEPITTWETVEEEGLEEAPIVEPAAELEAIEDDHLTEFEAPALFEAESESALEEEAIEPPVPTAADALETVAEALPDIGEPVADRLEQLEEDLDLAEAETPERPTWVALEEPPVAERPVAQVPPEEPPVTERPVVAQVPMVEEQIGEPEDDQTQLGLARRLWAAGQKEEAQAAYQELLSSPLRDDVTTDLERITGEGVPEETMLRLLGDAYMRENRLQEALDVYRRALASL